MVIQETKSGAETQWLTWQLVDSAFPSGGFAHSAGLEAAWQQGEVRDRAELASFVEASLRQFHRFALPFVVAVHRAPEELEELDGLCDQHHTNHVANRASRAQGKAFAASAQRIFSLPEVRWACGHFAPVFGAICRALALDCDAACALFFFNHLRSLTSSAVRLNLVGPLEAQRLQHRVASLAQSLLAEGPVPELAMVAQTAPLLELWQGGHDRLYSRLFQS